MHPAALAELRRLGIDWSHARPKSLADLPRREWDLVITDCDRARKTCPTFPGRPIVMHWSLPGPSEVTGSEEKVARTFQDFGMVLGRRIGLMLSLPVEKLGELADEPVAGSA